MATQPTTVPDSFADVGADEFVGFISGLDPSAYPAVMWDEHSEQFSKYYRYYFGDVLDEQVEGNKIKAPKYPIKINLARTVVLLTTFAMLGEWEDELFSWTSEQYKAGPGGRPVKTVDNNDPVLQYLEHIGRISQMQRIYVQQAITLNLLGVQVWAVRYRPELPTKVLWTAVPPEAFRPVFNSVTGEMEECLVTLELSGAEAARAYGMEDPGNTVIYQEHWTREGFTISLDGKRIKQGRSRGGVVPYVFVPRANVTGEAYGISVIDSIMGIQDEINLRMADIGDAINRETHKDIYVSNVPQGAKGIRRHGRFVDLGTSLGAHEPKIHDVDRGAVPQGSDKFIELLLDFSRYSANTPPVAYGVDEGSQRSSATLVMRMWPMLQEARMTRAMVANGFSELARISLAVFADKAPDYQRFYSLEFPAMLPKDREEMINEVVQLAGVGMISDERALDVLNVPESDRPDELKRLKSLREAENKLKMVAANQKQSQATRKPNAQPGSNNAQVRGGEKSPAK